MADKLRFAFIDPVYGVAEIVGSGGLVNIQGLNYGAPSNSVAGYEKGAFFQDLTNGNIYRNDGTSTSTTWTKLVAAGDTVATLTVTTLTYGTLNDGTTALAATAAEINRSSQLSTRVVTLTLSGTDSTTTITAAAHDGKTVVINNATKAAIINLPAPSGSGARYTFFLGTSITNGAGNSISFVAGTASSFFGTAWVLSDGAAAVLAYAAGGATTINFNGTTKGGLKGDWVEIEDVGATLYKVRVMIAETGTEATPFG